MASVVKIRRSSVAGKAPTVEQLELGELALNTRDGKLYSSTGHRVFEIGANTAAAQIGTLTVGNTSPFTLPTSDGVNGQVLKTDGNGQAYWAEDIVANSTVYAEYTYVANTSNQTVFTGADYNNKSMSLGENAVTVFLNGAKLHRNVDYTSNTSAVILDDVTKVGDILEVQTFNEKAHVVIVDAELTTSNHTHGSTNSEVVDSFGIADYRSAKYIVQVEDVGRNDSFQVSEILVLHDGSNAFLSETNHVDSFGRVARITAVISGGSVNLTVTPTLNQNIKTKVSRLSLTP
jgi:hypothetical protein